MVGAAVSLFVVLATLGVFVAVGLRARAHDVEDHLVARNSQSSRALGLSFLASGMGAWILFVPPEVGAFVGLVPVIGYALGAAAPFVVLALIGARLRRVVPTGHSLAEFVRARFGAVFHVYVIAVSVLYMLFFVTAELTAAGIIATILSDLDPRVVILAVAGATAAYTSYGGLRASIRTDRFQSWLILALLVLGAVAIATRLSGTPAPAPALLGVSRSGVEVAVTLIIAVTAANLFHQGYWQRVWAARDTPALRRGTALGVTATLVVMLLVGVMGIIAAGVNVPLGDPPAPFFALLTGAPTWLMGVVLVLGVALVASSVDTLETGLSSLIVAQRPSASLRAARLLTVVLLVPAVFVALQGYSVLRLFLVADLLAAATVVPALLSLWARGTQAGVLAGSLAGLVGAVLPGWFAGGSLRTGVLAATFPEAVPTLPPFLGALVVSAAVAVVVSLAQNRVADLEAVGARVPLLAHDQRAA